MPNEPQNTLMSNIVLYSAVAVFLVNIVALMATHNFIAVVLFCLTSIFINYYNKNMIIVIFVSLIVADLYVVFSKYFNKKEGMVNNKDINGKVSPDTANNTVHQSGNSKKCIGANCKKTKTGAGSGQSKMTPASVDGDDEDEDDTKVDYASTLENAYANLDKLLSSDAISSMTNDTQRLAEKQQALMGNINKLEPMMQKAGSLLAGLDMSNMEGMINKLSENLGGLGKKK